MLVSSPVSALQVSGGSCPDTLDRVDTLYGKKTRQMVSREWHTHNIYYHRNPWNSNGSFMVGVRSNPQQLEWRVVLYDGDGCFIKELFPITKYDWRLVWDRNNPHILYTWKGSNLHRYDVNSDKVELLKSFAPLGLKPNGPSLNQSGDRILCITSDDVFHSYRLPKMDDERSFKVAFPPGCFTDWEDERYIGHKDFIATGCYSSSLDKIHTSIYSDLGKLHHRFDGVGLGHSDFSPNGKWAYGKLWAQRGKGRFSEIHTVNIDGTDDRILYSVPTNNLGFIQSLHISWPDRVKDRFIVSFFPSAFNTKTAYSAPYDEILLLTVSGEAKFLARTETAVKLRRDDFWSQPLASPSGDGTRISFNSNRSGSIDNYILYVPPNLLTGKLQ